MNIPKDKIQHLIMGIGAAASTLVAVWIAQHSLGGACAFITTLFAVFYEAQQWYRREGQPDVMDAIATAAPGWAIWAALEVFRRISP